MKKTAKSVTDDLSAKAQDLLGAFLGGAGKAQFVQSLSNDMIMKLMDKVMEKVNPRLLLDEVLTRYDVEVSVKVSLQPKAKSKPRKERK